MTEWIETWYANQCVTARRLCEDVSDTSRSLSLADQAADQVPKGRRNTAMKTPQSNTETKTQKN